MALPFEEACDGHNAERRRAAGTLLSGRIFVVCGTVAG